MPRKTGKPGQNKRLYETILQLQTEEECERFFRDLCSPSELSAMEQRFTVAEMLRADAVYTDIMSATNASTATISRVSRMLNDGTGCMNTVMDRYSETERKDPTT